MIKLQPPWARRIAVTIGIAGLLYLVLCTYLWNILYGLFLGVVIDTTPARLATSPWCKPGDWVLETFQPMVSDQRMIDHLNKNKKEMTELAEMMARNRFLESNMAGRKPRFISLQKSLDMGDISNGGFWAERPYSLEDAMAEESCWGKIRNTNSTDAERSTCSHNADALGRRLSVVFMKPDFGKVWAQYFCSHAKTSSKGYVYYPSEAPRIVNGRLQDMISYYDGYKTYVSLSGGRLVPNLDMNPDPEEESNVLRQIDERWFIYRN